MPEPVATEIRAELGLPALDRMPLTVAEVVRVWASTVVPARVKPLAEPAG